LVDPFGMTLSCSGSWWRREHGVQDTPPNWVASSAVAPLRRLLFTPSSAPHSTHGVSLLQST